MQALRKIIGHQKNLYLLRKPKCLFYRSPSSLQISKELNLDTIACAGLYNRKNKFQNVNKQSLCPNRTFHEDRETKDVTVWGSLKNLRLSPVPALVLGASGLIPFVASPGYMILSGTYVSSVCFAQMAYGASILSFLGGVRWGYSIAEESMLRPDWINLGASVVPSLVAWTGLLFPHPGSLFMVMTGIAAAGYYDMVTWGYPPWFKGLRFVLTFVAVISLWTTLMCQLLLKKEESNDLQKENLKSEEENKN